MRARRLPVLDRVDRQGEAVVLVGREVVRLSALAVELVDHCAGWTEASDLARAVVARFGPPPEGVDPTVATVDALTSLQRRGLVELG